MIARAGVVAAIVTLGWALAIYPIAFEYASREARAAGAHKLAFFPAAMASVTSGWFIVFLILSATVAFASVRQIGEARSWRVIAWAVSGVSLGLLAIHVLYDGPVTVAENFWSAVTHPTSFRWPLEYFRVAIQNLGSWP